MQQKTVKIQKSETKTGDNFKITLPKDYVQALDLKHKQPVLLTLLPETNEIKISNPNIKQEPKPTYKII